MLINRLIFCFNTQKSLYGTYGVTYFHPLYTNQILFPQTTLILLIYFINTYVIKLQIRKLACL